jgi:hypothetical protein
MFYSLLSRFFAKFDLTEEDDLSSELEFETDVKTEKLVMRFSNYISNDLHVKLGIPKNILIRMYINDGISSIWMQPNGVF